MPRYHLLHFEQVRYHLHGAIIVQIFPTKTLPERLVRSGKVFLAQNHSIGLRSDLQKGPDDKAVMPSKIVSFPQLNENRAMRQWNTRR